MDNKITNKSDYGSRMNPDKIPCSGTADDITEKRFDKILDIRKFEIELYWKRATYFWTFIAAALTAYGLSVTKDNPNDNILKFQFFIICIGIVFSLAWYLINKGSKFWQENWEKHLDLTEDDVVGPLYKTIISKKTYSSFWNPTKPYAVSVSKTNQILSLFIFIIWLIFLVVFLIDNFKHFTKYAVYFYCLSSLTISIFFYLIFGTRTSTKPTVVDFDIREIKNMGKKIKN